jgi:HEAT repeat protein
MAFASGPAPIPALERLKRHADDEVRRQVARALPWWSDHGSEPVVMLLLELMEDDDGDARDSATFGTGVLLDVDGPNIRAAFERRLGDPVRDVRLEDLRGLARRRHHG